MKTDNWDPGSKCKVLDVANFLGVHFTKGATHEREVLGVGENVATIYPARAGHDAVSNTPPAVHTQFGRPVFYEGVQLDEAPFV